MMKKLCTISALAMSFSMFCFSAVAEPTAKTEQTQSETAPAYLPDGAIKTATELSINEQYISVIQVSTGETAGVIYLSSEGGWNVYQPGSQCPNPGYAMIRTDKGGANELQSVALTAKTLNKPITLIGVCGHHPNYFEISSIIY